MDASASGSSSVDLGEDLFAKLSHTHTQTHASSRYSHQQSQKKLSLGHIIIHLYINVYTYFKMLDGNGERIPQFSSEEMETSSDMAAAASMIAPSRCNVTINTWQQKCHVSVMFSSLFLTG